MYQLHAVDSLIMAPAQSTNGDLKVKSVPIFAGV